MRLWPPLAVCAVLAGCAAPAPPPAGPTADLTAQLLQYRRDAAHRVVQVKVENRGQVGVRITGVQISAPGHADTGRAPKDTALAPRRRVDLPVPMGDVRCEQQAVPESVVVRVWLAGGPAPVQPPLTDVSVLARIHERECAQLRARKEVEVGFEAGSWTPDGEGVLRVRALGSREVDVLAVEGTTLFSAAAGALPAGLTAASGPVAVPVRTAPQRCDPHAIGESKRGYAFGVRVRVEEHPDVLLTVEPDEPARRLLQEALLARCGLAGSASP